MWFTLLKHLFLQDANLPQDILTYVSLCQLDFSLNSPETARRQFCLFKSFRGNDGLFYALLTPQKMFPLRP